MREHYTLATGEANPERDSTVHAMRRMLAKPPARRPRLSTETRQSLVGTLLLTVTFLLIWLNEVLR